VNKIKGLARVHGNATHRRALTPPEEISLRNFCYAFYYVFTFSICNFVLVYRILGLVGSAVVMAEISPAPSRQFILSPDNTNQDTVREPFLFLFFIAIYSLWAIMAWHI